MNQSEIQTESISFNKNLKKQNLFYNHNKKINAVAMSIFKNQHNTLNL